jgi:hypothetical protein
MANPSAAEIAEIDEFMVLPKWLDGGRPLWKPSSFHKREGNEYEAIWSIKDDLGIVGKGQLRFTFRPWNRLHPSISLVFGQRPVMRLDFEDEIKCESNPLYAVRLPARVCGNHVHTWEANRNHISSQDIWTLTCREPLPPQVRKLDQGLGWLADYANIKLEPDQYGFEIPQGVL